jgi:hypothetical protein
MERTAIVCIFLFYQQSMLPCSAFRFQMNLVVAHFCILPTESIYDHLVRSTSLMSRCDNKLIITQTSLLICS